MVLTDNGQGALAGDALTASKRGHGESYFFPSRVQGGQVGAGLQKLHNIIKNTTLNALALYETLQHR